MQGSLQEELCYKHNKVYIQQCPFPECESPKHCTECCAIWKKEHAFDLYLKINEVSVSEQILEHQILNKNNNQELYFEETGQFQIMNEKQHTYTEYYNLQGNYLSYSSMARGTIELYEDDLLNQITDK